jgi:cell division protein FtsA
MKDLKVVFDIGNGYIKGIIFDIQDGQTTVLAKHMVKTRWMRKGKIMDVEDFSVCINEVLEAFAKKLWGDVVEEVFVWISHPETVIKRVSEQKRVLDGKITHDDVAHLSDVITESSVHANYEVLKLVPIQWILDEQTKVKDPIDMEARKLELVADVFMIPKTFFNNLMDAFQKLDVYVGEIVPNILGACEIALDFDVKDLWVLLVDIGANQTTYVVYEDGIPLFYGMIPLWGEDVTKDVSIGLQVDIKDAERIKREKAIIMMDWPHVEDETVDMAFLSEIVLARYEEIFELIQTDLVRYQKDGRLPWGVVMLWWGAQVENVTLLAKEVFKLATYKAKDGVLRLPELTHSSEWLNALWLYVWVNKYHHPRSRWFKFSMDFKFLHGIADFFRKIF